jgi:hypothetical protein
MVNIFGDIGIEYRLLPRVPTSGQWPIERCV